jgi:hypothetical protein
MHPSFIIRNMSHINPSKVLLVACHCNNSNIVVYLYIHFNCGFMGKWHTIFMGTWVLPTCLYLALPHFGQWVCPTYWPLYKTHREIQAWILLYSKPTCWHKVFAPYMLLDKQLFTGNMNLCSNENNSSTNLFEHPCIVHVFTMVIVIASLLHWTPQYRGMQAPCNIATLSTLFRSTLLRYSWARFKCGCSRDYSLGLISTMPLLHLPFHKLIAPLWL